MLYNLSRWGDDMKTVGQVSKEAGISVRTLHHYDSIGLLKPSSISDSGYRYYDEASLKKLQIILLFRELDFSLNEINSIVNNESFDVDAALTEHLKILKLKRERLENIIGLVQSLIEKGEYSMSLNAFDKSKIESYEKEVKERWGTTFAYKEFIEKSKIGNFDTKTDTLLKMFSKFGLMKNSAPSDSDVQKSVFELQQFITDNFYNCTKEILSSLGQMYCTDERFKETIDRAGGIGTAEFVCDAIKIYCE